MPPETATDRALQTYANLIRSRLPGIDPLDLAALQDSLRRHLGGDHLEMKWAQGCVWRIVGLPRHKSRTRSGTLTWSKDGSTVEIPPAARALSRPRPWPWPATLEWLLAFRA